MKLFYFLLTTIGCFAYWCPLCYHCRVGGKFGDGCLSSWFCVFPTTYTSVYRNVKKIEVFTVLCLSKSKNKNFINNNLFRKDAVKLFSNEKMTLHY